MTERYGIVAARFNEPVVRRLVDGAHDFFTKHGLVQETVWVPGAFELPIVAKALVSTGKYAAVVCLGAVIRGETAHFDFVAGQAAEGIMRVGLETGTPTIFGVLTTETVEQAMERSGGAHGNKGWDAAAAAVETVAALREVTGP